MNIVLTFDNNYTQHAAVVIASACYNNKKNITFYVVSDYISEKNLSRLNEIVFQYNCTIKYVQLSLDSLNEIDKFPIGKKTANTYINKSAYYRLFIPYVLDIDKALYLDCDIVVSSDLSELYNYSFHSEICIASLEDNIAVSSKGPSRLGYPSTYSYFNSGVLLLDLNLMRTLYSFTDLLKCLEERKNSIMYHDQDVLNILFHNHKVFIPLIYNVMDVFLIKNINLPPSLVGQYKSVYNPTVIHYSGSIKPWHKECKNPYRFEYLRYLRMTPWNGICFSYKYDTIGERLIYIIKNVIKKVLEFLHVRYFSYIVLD